ncbi:MAG: hypothetical protein ACE5J9_04930 [Methanosarcinales archaeon]
MSTKLKIRIKKLIDPELDLKFPDYGELIRLSCLIQFKTESGWSKLYEAILDTGAHTSVIPEYIWKKISTECITDHLIQGIVANGARVYKPSNIIRVIYFIFY